MLGQADTSGTARVLTQIWQADTNGTARQLQQLWQADTNGTARMIYSTSAGVSLSPTDANGYVATKGSAPAYTNSLTVSGYSGTPTIVWTVPTGWSVVNQGAATTNFKSPALAAGDDISADGSVTITSSGSNQTLPFSLYASNQGYV